MNMVTNMIIPLFFLYFVLSIIATGITQILAGIFSWRGQYLIRGLDAIMSGDDNEGVSPSARWRSIREFLEFHFVVGAPQTAFERSRSLSVGMPASDSAADIERTIREQERMEAYRRVLSVVDHPLIRATRWEAPSDIPAGNFSLAMLDCLADRTGTPLFIQIKNAIEALPENKLKRTLSIFAVDADYQATDGNQKVTLFKGHLERWFLNMVSSTDAIYLRSIKWMMLVVGLGIAVGGNINTFRVIESLWETPRILALGEAAAKAVTGTETTTPSDLQSAWNQLDDSENSLSNQIPFGWRGPHKFIDPADWPAVVMGWLFTACATAAGAQFWLSVVPALPGMLKFGAKSSESGET
jgi:hypothetical protein